MPTLIANFPQIKLRIGGTGPLKKRLAKLVRINHLQKHVEFVGYVNDTERFFKSLDVYVNVAYHESFGLSLLESLEYSLPAIATHVDEIPNLLGNGDFGRLICQRYVNPRSKKRWSATQLASEMIEALNDVIKDPLEWQQRAYRGFLFYRDTLSSAKMAEGHRRVFEQETRPGICIVSPVVTHATGGVQKQIKLQSEELHSLGYRVFIVQRHDPHFVEKAGQWQHVEFLPTADPFAGRETSSRITQRAKGLLFVLTAVYAIYKKRRRISVIHAHQLYSPTLVAVVARILFGVRIVVKVTASGTLGEMRELKRLPFLRLRKLAFTKIDRLIVLSEEMKNEMLELGFKISSIKLLPNSVKIPAVSRYDQGFGQSRSNLQILFCGRLSKEKCLDDLLKAAAQVSRTTKKCTVHLVGGAYGGRDVTDSLKKLAGTLPGLEVLFHGDQAEVSSFYLRADVFVLPSESEGMSNALLEALSFGVPCVASDIAPNQSLLTHDQNGLLFRQGDYSDLARQLERLAQDQNGTGELSQRLGREAKRNMKEKFSTEAICKELVKLYSTVAPFKMGAAGR
jgi:glycosyltransferase involved in cell wall biosynthesis